MALTWEGAALLMLWVQWLCHYKKQIRRIENESVMCVDFRIIVSQLKELSSILKGNPYHKISWVSVTVFWTCSIYKRSWIPGSIQVSGLWVKEMIFFFPPFFFSWWAPIPQTCCLWGRHHQPKRLKAPLKQFQRISLLDNNSTVFTQMPKYKTSMTSNISPQPLQSTLVTRLSHGNAFNSALIYCYLKRTIRLISGIVNPLCESSYLKECWNQFADYHQGKENRF